MLRTLLACTTLLGLALAAIPAMAADKYQKAHGLTIVAWSAKVGEDRFRSPRDFPSTVKFYEKLFVGNRHVKKYREINLPGIKYTHFANTNPKGEWSGVNIYQAGERGEVRIYVLKRLPDKATQPAKADK